ncbi:MAG: hypothetical protein NC203_12245, partial [Firmicutes bacterium]|nr:hypothetical protein [Bacillota bacterium]
MDSFIIHQIRRKFKKKIRLSPDCQIRLSKKINLVTNYSLSKKSKLINFGGKRGLEKNRQGF